MLATFCFRLAWGLIASLLVLTVSQVPPRFFRVQYLTALGLLAVAAFFSLDAGGLDSYAAIRFWFMLGISMILALAGSIIWHVEGHPGHRVVLILANICLFWLALDHGNTELLGPPLLMEDDMASAAVLGAATSAMLMGHSYLIAPAMSLKPLYRLLAALAVALVARIVLACVGLSLWTGHSSAGNLETETQLWLVVRWVVGLGLPLVLTWLAWETARIRSTQSATGILYVVVILVFLGELTSLLLLEKTGFVL